MSIYLSRRLFVCLSAIAFVLTRLTDVTGCAVRSFVDLSLRVLSSTDCNARLLLDRIGRMVGFAACNARAIFAFMRRALRHARYSSGSFSPIWGASA